MELPFEDSSFDGAYAIESIVHMRDKNAVFGHLARVLRPGARLVVADIYQNGEISDEDADHLKQMNRRFHGSLLTADTYREHLHRAGLQLVEFTDIRENVHRSHDSVAAAARQAALTIGGKTSSQLTAMAYLIEQISMLPQISYMLLTAVRDPLLGSVAPDQN